LVSVLQRGLIKCEPEKTEGEKTVKIDEREFGEKKNATEVII